MARYTSSMSKEEMDQRRDMRTKWTDRQLDQLERLVNWLIVDVEDLKSRLPGAPCPDDERKPADP